MRPQQEYAIQSARAAFKSGKKFVIIEAPTGAGKSGIAVAMAREAESAFLLTGQKILQDQYAKDFKDLALVKGRSNYQCLVMDTHAGAAPCSFGIKYDACEPCAYYEAKNKALENRTVLLNYSYFLAEMNLAGTFGERELLILDEAHNTEGMLMNFVEVTISSQQLREAGIHTQLPTDLQTIEEHVKWVSELTPRIKSALKRIEARASHLGMPPPTLTTQKQDFEHLKRNLGLLKMVNSTEWVLEKSEPNADFKQRWWKFKPIGVAKFAKSFLWQYAKKVLILSATILDPRTFRRTLGIAEADCEYIPIQSDFPVANRPIKALNTAKLNRDSLEAEFPKVIAELKVILERHKDQKGIIHSHSYAITERLVTALNNPRLLRHRDGKTREMTLERHLAAKSASVLITPSMTEGVDLADDQARWQVIVKIPYPYIGDPQINARRLKDPNWYQWRTALVVVQAYGRAIRNKDDKAITYILDAGFTAWVQNQKKTLPSWFLEAIV
jgi:ATP-dependent DNA helicase DinG